MATKPSMRMRAQLVVGHDFQDGNLAKLGYTKPLIYINALTRTEATDLERHFRSEASPEVRAMVARAYANPSDPAHKAVRLYAEVINYFKSEHPVLANGEPAPWPATEPEPPKIDPAAPTAERFKTHTPEQAAARLEWAEAQPEYVEAFGDGKHALHQAYVDETLALRNIIAGGAQDPGQPSPQGGDRTGQAQAGDPAALAEIARLQSDKDFMRRYSNKRAIGHDEAVRQMAELHERAYPTAPGGQAAGAGVGAQSGGNSPAPASPAPKSGGPPAGFESRVAALRQQLKDAPRGSPARETIQRQLTSEYETAFPQSALPEPGAIKVGGA